MKKLKNKLHYFHFHFIFCTTHLFPYFQTVLIDITISHVSAIEMI